MKTLLQLIQGVTGQIGLPQPASIIGSQDGQIIQLLGLLTQLGEDIVRGYEWQQLTKPYYLTTTPALSGTCSSTINSPILSGFHSVAGVSVGMVLSGLPIPPYTEVAAVGGGTITMTYPALSSTASVSMNFLTQDYALPSDFDRMVPDTNWDRTDHWRNLGPKTSQEWQWLQGGVISIGPRERWRVLGNKLRLFAAPASPLNIAYEYVSNQWIIAHGGSTPSLSAFVNDGDTNIFKDDVLEHGLKYYWFEAKGLDYSAHLNRFNRALSSAKAQDVPLGVASLASQPVPELVGPWSVADGSWPTQSIN